MGKSPRPQRGKFSENTPLESKNHREFSPVSRRPTQEVRTTRGKSRHFQQFLQHVAAAAAALAFLSSSREIACMHFHGMLSSSPSPSSFSSARSHPAALSSLPASAASCYPLPSYSRTSVADDDDPSNSFRRHSSAPLPYEEVVEIRKPYTDRRQYRYLCLSNGMKVLLIIDSACDEAAASIRVAAGSAADPAALPGLAHFTEHMLFRGSRRYPRHTDYFNYIHRHGGYANAFTSRFATVFSFSITPAFLQPALERMADAFAAPLLGKDQMDKEVHAVHAEYQIDVNDDARRAAHLIRQSKEDTPFSRFTVGNIESLSAGPQSKGIDLQAAMREFHDRWYSPNLMTLAVVGPPPLSKLEAFVRSRFEQIPNRNVPALAFEECGPNYLPLAPSELGLQTFAVPEGDRREALFVFYLPPQAKQWKEKPLSYLSFLLGHEGPGSLASKLKKENLASSFSVSSSSPELCTIFEVGVHLTDVARNQESLQRIGYLLFLFLRALAVRPPEHWRLEELQYTRLLGFLFAEMPKAYDLSVDAAEGLHYYPPREVLAGDTLLYSLNATKVKEYIDSYICPSKVRLFVFDKQLAAGSDRVEPWFRIKHRVSPVQPHALRAWEELYRLPAADVWALMHAQGMHLPGRNSLIPQRLTFYNIHPQQQQDQQQEPLVLEVKQLQQREGASWQRQPWHSQQQCSTHEETQERQHGQQQQDSTARSQDLLHGIPADTAVAPPQSSAAARFGSSSADSEMHNERALQLPSLRGQRHTQPSGNHWEASRAPVYGPQEEPTAGTTAGCARQSARLHLGRPLPQQLAEGLLHAASTGVTQELFTSSSCDILRPRRRMASAEQEHTQEMGAAPAAHYPAPLVFPATHVCHNLCTIFHKLDDSFRTPRVVVKLHLYYTSSLDDPLLEQLLTDVYLDTVGLSLRELLYDAAVAGISFSLRHGVSVHASGLPLVHREKGLTLFLSGYVDQLLSFLARVPGALPFRQTAAANSSPATLLDSRLHTQLPTAAPEDAEKPENNWHTNSRLASKLGATMPSAALAAGGDDALKRELAETQPLRLSPQDAITEVNARHAPRRRNSQLRLSQREPLHGAPLSGLGVSAADTSAAEAAEQLPAKAGHSWTSSFTDSSVEGAVPEDFSSTLPSLTNGELFTSSFLSNAFRRGDARLRRASISRDAAAAATFRRKRNPLHAPTFPSGSTAFFQWRQTRKWGRSPAMQRVGIHQLHAPTVAAGSSSSYQSRVAPSEAAVFSGPSALETDASGSPPTPSSPFATVTKTAPSSLQTGVDGVKEWYGQLLLIGKAQAASTGRSLRHQWKQHQRENLQQQWPRQLWNLQRHARLLQSQEQQHQDGAGQQEVESNSPEPLASAPLFEDPCKRGASGRSGGGGESAAAEAARTSQSPAAEAQASEPLLQQQFLALALQRLRTGLELATFNRSPSRQAEDAALEVLLHPYTPVHALRERLQQFIREKQQKGEDLLPALLLGVRSWALLLWKKAAVEGLIQGNIRAGDATVVIQALLKALPLQQIISIDEISRERTLPFTQVAAAWKAHLSDIHQADDYTATLSATRPPTYAGAAWSLLKAAAAAALQPPGTSATEEKAAHTSGEKQGLRILETIAAAAPGALVSVEKGPRSAAFSVYPPTPTESRPVEFLVPPAKHTAAALPAAELPSEVATLRTSHLSSAATAAGLPISVAEKRALKDAAKEPATRGTLGEPTPAKIVAFAGAKTPKSAGKLPTAATRASPAALSSSVPTARPALQSLGPYSATEVSGNAPAPFYAASTSASATDASPSGTDTASGGALPLRPSLVRAIQAGAPGESKLGRSVPQPSPEVKAGPISAQQQSSIVWTLESDAGQEDGADAAVTQLCIGCEQVHAAPLGCVHWPSSEGHIAREIADSSPPEAARMVQSSSGHHGAVTLCPRASVRARGSLLPTNTRRIEKPTAGKFLQEQLAEQAAEEVSTDGGAASAAEEAVEGRQDSWQLQTAFASARIFAQKVLLLARSALPSNRRRKIELPAHSKWGRKLSHFHAVLPRMVQIRRLQVSAEREILREKENSEVGESVQQEQEQQQTTPLQDNQQQQEEKALPQQHLPTYVVGRMEEAAANLRSHSAANVRLRVRLPNWNIHDEKNQAHLFVEIGPLSSIKERALLYLVHRWMGQEFFNRMRTDEQLGYLTAMHVNRLEDTYYYLFTITTSYDPARVAERMAHFLRGERRKFMTPQEFQHFQQAAIDVWKQQPKGLSDEFAKFYREIAVRDYIFDLDEKMVDELRRLTPQSVSQFREATLYTGPWMQIAIVSQRKTPQDLAADHLSAGGALYREAEPPWVEVNPRATASSTAETF